MASGHVNRIKRPNTWLHRPTLQREDSPCQLGAVHTWPIADLFAETMSVGLPVRTLNARNLRSFGGDADRSSAQRLH
jgi:hypothetical protein